MNAHQRLIYMANHIAINFGTLKPEAAAAAVAEHIALFWDPRMKTMIFADDDGLSPVAKAAIETLKRENKPEQAARAN